MASRVESTSRVLTTDRDAEMARGVLDDLDGPHGSLRVDQGGPQTSPIPVELGRILQQVLEVMANGGTVTISATPDELTTSSAAAVLGVSRPTLLKMVAEGRLPAHRVGSHTRFHAPDVFAERRARRARERAAFDSLRLLDDDDGDGDGDE